MPHLPFLKPAVDGNHGLRLHAVLGTATRAVPQLLQLESHDATVHNLGMFALVVGRVWQVHLEECPEPQRVAEDDDRWLQRCGTAL
eukprot:CAMPEP_0171113300 /NCGR_PEP_ID=MMETSP0766_2-20121228/81863_1 /TAXON_ID=439317 /ORGANISM="Gambierdiscus australes, Strain CAWD 149" /LENGTH=85 /DNA_ID=CAMNT_0011575493 /DNA_START=46 /DNA_END=303 /DNA_ORIENTATION=+